MKRFRRISLALTTIAAFFVLAGAAAAKAITSARPKEVPCRKARVHAGRAIGLITSMGLTFGMCAPLHFARR